MKHIKIEVFGNEYQQEELIALLDEHNPTGFEQTDEKLLAYFEETGFEREAVLKLLESYPHQLTEVEEKNWNAEWERDFQPVIVDDFVAVRAHFHQPATGVLHEIIITPKMSFGTGHHATTYMMMEQMRNLNFKSKVVFDFGTGTGILAILAEKLGAAKVTAIDIDEWSIENAHENIRRNDCFRIDVMLSTTIPANMFDIILANINRNVILDYLPILAKALKPDASILFSGLLLADEEAIKQTTAENKLVLQSKGERQGWLSLLFAKR